MPGMSLRLSYVPSPAVCVARCLTVTSSAFHKGLRSPLWNADDVTVRHLATHTAGLGTYDNRNDIPGIETIRRYGIVFTRPGETFDYSNLGYGVLGQIITDVSGRGF